MRRRLNRKVTYALLLVISVVLLIADLLSKMAVRANLDTGEAAPFIPNLVEIRLAFNDGAAFGMFGGAGVVFVGIAIFVVAVIIVSTALRPDHAIFETIAEALVIAGATGNAIDRIGDGLVTDFLNLLFINFAIFNIADICLTCGVALWLIWLIYDGFKLRKSMVDEQQ
jgi:signal peptidase II